MKETLLAMLKNELFITWEDTDTDLKLARIISNAIPTLNHKLGANIDYTVEGQEQELFIAYCVYAYNGRLNQFDEAYRNNIAQIRQLYEVEQFVGDDNEA